MVKAKIHNFRTLENTGGIMVQITYRAPQMAKV